MDIQKIDKYDGYAINENNMSQIKEGDILLMTPVKNVFLKHFISWCIKKVTGYYWTHSLVSFGKELVVESIIDGVTLRDILEVNEYVNDYNFIALRFKDENLKSRFTEAVETRRGYKYDYIQALLMGVLKWLRDVFQRKKIRSIHLKADNERRYVCSELIADSLYDIGINVITYTDINRSQFMPEDLLLLGDVLELVEIQKEGDGT